MAKYYFTRKAVEDLTSIWNYTFDKWSEKQADKYYEMLINMCREVAESPSLLGRKYDEVADGLYGIKANRHIIFYRVVESAGVEIVRILHERMDLRNELG